jgi:hypothetical protein
MPDRDDRHPGSYRHNPSPYPNPSHFPDSQVRRPFKPALTVVRDIPVGEHGEVGVLQAFLASLENPAGSGRRFSKGGPMTGGCDLVRPQDDPATGPPAQPESSIDSRRG